MSAPTCIGCEHAVITLHSATDKCKHPQNTNGVGLVAMRNNENLCGQAGALFVVRTTSLADPLVVPKAQPAPDQQQEVVP